MHCQKRVVLREVRKSDDSRFLSAEIRANGDLVFEGQDLGSGVEGVFGYREYEWSWIVKADDIPLFQNALDSNDAILTLLKKNFSDENAAKICDFMQNNNIPFESWRRIGD